MYPSFTIYLLGNTLNTFGHMTRYNRTAIFN